MDSQTIRTALGLLQEDPENAEAWQALQVAVEVPEGDLPAYDLLHLLSLARQQHRERGEWDAVGGLLQLAIGICSDADQAAELLVELAKVQGDELLDEAAARETLSELMDLAPANPVGPAA